MRSEECNKNLSENDTSSCDVCHTVQRQWRLTATSDNDRCRCLDRGDTVLHARTYLRLRPSYQSILFSTRIRLFYTESDGSRWGNAMYASRATWTSSWASRSMRHTAHAVSPDLTRSEGQWGEERVDARNLCEILSLPVTLQTRNKFSLSTIWSRSYQSWGA